LGKAAMVHVTPGLDGVSRAVNQAENGLLPAEATIVTGQPAALDPSRAPRGKAILWLQLQELPSQGELKGDALGEIAAPADGKWTVEVAEKYADRIIDRLARHIPNLKSAMLARKVLSPADLAQANINLVGGDPYSGACSLDQFFFWRPLRAVKNHSTPVEGLYQIGASTHPGPGLGGVSGLLTAKELLA
jgi:phytoene dehydrogenase-like protein